MRKTTWNKTPYELNTYERVVNLPQSIRTVLLVMISSSVLIATALLLVKATAATVLSILFMGGFSSLLYFANQRGHHKVAAFGAFLLVCGVLTYNMFTFNGIYDVGLIALPVVIVFASLLLGYQFILPIVLIVLSLVSMIYKLSLDGIVTPYDGRITTQNQDFWTIIAALLITGALVYIIMSLIEQNVTRILNSEARLRKTYESTLHGWSKAIEMRDKETEGHSIRVTDLTIELAKRLGVPGKDLEHIRWGALLHDVGKMGLPDSILRKAGKLDEQEYQKIKDHPGIAKLLLGNIPHLEKALVIPHYHHERWDGSGYPDGLKGEEIPLAARIFAVVDVWDALISERPYKEAWSVTEAKAYFMEQSGNLFDPKIVEAFLQFITPPESK